MSKSTRKPEKKAAKKPEEKTSKKKAKKPVQKPSKKTASSIARKINPKFDEKTSLDTAYLVNGSDDQDRRRLARAESRPALPDSKRSGCPL